MPGDEDRRERGGPIDGATAEIRPWETLQDDRVADCTIFQVRRLLQRSPVSGAEGRFHVISSPDWVNVVPVTGDGHIVLIRQYRHGSGEITLEVPGGSIDKGETPLEAGVRELLEETGFGSSNFRVIGSVRSNPALFDNRAFTVLATDVKRVADPNPDQLEEIAVELYPPEEVDRMLREGTITHALTVNALFRYRLWCEGNGSAEGIR